MILARREEALRALTAAPVDEIVRLATPKGCSESKSPAKNAGC
jgi:hypothetical protein